MRKQWIVIASLMLGFVQPTLANKFFLSKAYRSPVATRSGNLQYYGGPVISNVKVYLVYWTAAANLPGIKGIADFYKSFSQSNSLDWINEYQTNITAVDGRQGTNQTIGHGTFGGEFTINPTQMFRATIDDKEIQKELEAQMDAGNLPPSDANSLYMIHFPAGVTITSDGATSCQQFCAYHGGYTSQKYGQIAYGVVPNLGAMSCMFGCGLGKSQLVTTTIAASHEVTEAVTDVFPTPGTNPAYPQAWNTSDGYEIGDLCQSSSATLMSTGQVKYTIQGEYDNSTSSCREGSFTGTPEFLAPY